MPIVFGIVFMAVALPRVSGIDCVNDIALFVESKAAVVTHVFLLSCKGASTLLRGAAARIARPPIRPRRSRHRSAVDHLADEVRAGRRKLVDPVRAVHDERKLLEQRLAWVEREVTRVLWTLIGGLSLMAGGVVY
jgi:hypothetical protein